MSDVVRVPSSRRVALVCPALNEEETVGAIVRAGLAKYPIVIVVDDGSVDRTGAIAESEGAQVIRHPFNLGVGAALQSGFRLALRLGADIAVQVDADGQHSVDSIDLLLDGIEENVMMVIGSRFARMDVRRPSNPRGYAMRLLSLQVRRLTGLEMSDVTSGFRAIRRPLLDHFARDFPAAYLGDTFGAMLLAHRLGYEIREVPVEMAPRQGGTPSNGPLKSSLMLLKALASSNTVETRPKR